MDTSLNIPAPAAVSQATPALPRAITTKVQALERANTSATLPSEKPFVAQVVNAQLAGTDVPDTPSDIAPAERTLRPYDVPMLPYASPNDLIAAPETVENTADTMEFATKDR